MDEQRLGECDAPGCPLPAAIRMPGSPWTCIAHAGATKGDYASITAMVANRRDVFQAALRMSMANYGDAVDATQRKWLADRGYTVTAGASLAPAGQALLSQLVREVRTPQKQMPPDIKKQAAADFNPDT